MTKNWFSYFGAVGAVIFLTVAPAAYLSHKETVQAEMLAQAAIQLSQVPAHFGSWTLREESSLSESVLNLLGCSHHLCRTYVHRETGDAVALVYLVGPAGPLAVHTPEICLTSREYEHVEPSKAIEIVHQGQRQEFFSTLFRAKTLEGQKLHVYYGWSRDGDQWEAPQLPRIALGPLPMLYKLQVACAETAIPTQEPTAGLLFLQDLMSISHPASSISERESSN